MASKKKARPRKVQRSQFMLERINVADHTTPFEKRLAVFLTSKCAKSRLSVSDIKDIVWNENDHNLCSRLVFMIVEENPKTKLEDVMEILNDAWNNFPHKSLNGLAPRDVVERASVDPDFIPEARPDFYAICADRFPKEVRVVTMRDHDWSFEFPAFYHARRAELADMREKLKETGEMEPANEMVADSQDLMHDMILTAARVALESDPLYFDAATIVAQDAFESGEERRAKTILENSIFEGRKLFPAAFKLGVDRLPWGFVDNRPFILLLGEYAMLVEAADGAQKAIPLYEEILALNPNDNTGIREYLATAFLKTNRLEELINLDAKYPGDLAKGLAVGVLLALYKLGRLDEARARIDILKKHAANVFREILKSDHPQPELTPGRVHVGGDDEAWLYWEDQGTFWMTAPGARDFLREHFKT